MLQLVIEQRQWLLIFNIWQLFILKESELFCDFCTWVIEINLVCNAY